MDLDKKLIPELRAMCKEKGLKNYSGKNKTELISMLSPSLVASADSSSRTQPRTYKVLSLFTGMGGMDVGFAEQVIVRQESVCTGNADSYIYSPYSQIEGFVNLKRLPFETVFQNDILPEAKRVAELNQWNHNYHLKDIRELLTTTTTPSVFPAADVITGGFPCQDFSHAGKRKGFDSSRGTLYQAYVELVKRVKPMMFIAENVNGLLTMPGEPIKTIIADFSAAGYEVKYQLMKSEEFGIPQTRWRVIIMGLRLDVKHSSLPADWNVITENRCQTHIRPYFAHLEEPDVSQDPAQQVYSRAAKLEKGQGQKEVGLDEFGPTMRAEHHGNIEFRRVATDSKNGEPGLAERRLSVREAALIQTFPPNCILTDTKKTSKAYKPIGNAVPPLLGYIIGRKVMQILEVCQRAV